MTGYVYFIKTEKTNQVKIGYSSNPLERLKSLQTGNPEKLILIGQYPGTPTLEKALHAFFEDKRNQLEWFNFTAADIEALKRFMAVAGQTPAIFTSSLSLSRVRIVPQPSVPTVDNKALQGLPHELRAIADYATRANDWLTARECVQNIRVLKGQSTEQVRAMFRGLADHGVGTLQGDGDRLQFRSNPPVAIAS